jgi:hypothetical protein
MDFGIEKKRQAVLMRPKVIYSSHSDKQLSRYLRRTFNNIDATADNGCKPDRWFPSAHAVFDRSSAPIAAGRILPDENYTIISIAY